MKPTGLFLQQQGNTIRFRVRVQPRASRDRISGWSGEALKVHLTAPPVEDRANRQLVKFLCGLLRIPTRRLQIVAGQKSRTKTVAVEGISADSLNRILERLLPD